MRTFLVAMLLLTAALAGCSDKGRDDGRGADGASSTTASSAPTSPAASASATTTSAAPSPAPKANHAPTATLGSNATSGTAPLMVRFTLGGSDPDGDPLTFTLSFGDGSANRTGTLPATVDHTYTPGNRTVRLQVSDGKLSDDATLTVSAGAPGLPPPAVFTGKATGSCNAFNPVTLDAICLPEDSSKRHNVTVPAGARHAVAFLDWSVPVNASMDLDLHVVDGAGNDVASSTCANVTPVPNPDVPFFGPYWSCVRGSDEEAVVDPVAPGTQAWTLVVVPYQAYELDYTLTVTFT